MDAPLPKFLQKSNQYEIFKILSPKILVEVYPKVQKQKGVIVIISFCFQIDVNLYN